MSRRTDAFRKCLNTGAITPEESKVIYEIGAGLGVPPVVATALFRIWARTTDFLEPVLEPVNANKKVQNVVWDVMNRPQEGGFVERVIVAHCSSCNTHLGFHDSPNKPGAIADQKFRCPCAKQPVAIPADVLHAFETGMVSETVYPGTYEDLARANKQSIAHGTYDTW